MQERRRTQRNRSYLGGQIAFNNRHTTFGCLVRNVSQNGAKIEVPSTVAIPDEFDLLISSREENRRARLGWRTDAEIGVVFSSPSTGSVLSLDAARQMKNLKAERDALAKRAAQLSEPV